MIANVPTERSIYERELRGNRSCIIGSKKARVLPEPVCDWINTSRGGMVLSYGLRKYGNEAFWMEVGLLMLILDRRWLIRSRFSPRPSNVDESANGALLGVDLGCSALSLSERLGKMGFEVKSDETIL